MDTPRHSALEILAWSGLKLCPMLLSITAENTFWQSFKLPLKASAIEEDDKTGRLMLNLTKSKSKSRRTVPLLCGSRFSLTHVSPKCKKLIKILSFQEQFTAMRDLYMKNGQVRGRLTKASYKFFHLFG
jgi:hypothetical protein